MQKSPAAPFMYKKVDPPQRRIKPDKENAFRRLLSDALKDLTDNDIEKEVQLIMDKKSKLPAKQRQVILYTFQKMVEKQIEDQKIKDEKEDKTDAKI